jgi:hypothetical protein
MAGLHCYLREKQRVYCKNRECKCMSKIKTDLDLLFGDNALPYRTIAKLMFRMCARWIPHLLTSDKKRERALLTRFKDRDPNNFSPGITYRAHACIY